MNTILFSTTNKHKIAEARAACDLFDIEVEPIELHFDEIQSHDPLQISKHKVDTAFALADAPAIIVADTSWSIPALGGFPGGYMKDVIEWFTAEDFINLMNDKTDREIIFRESIVYKDAHETKIFSKEYKGLLTKAPRGSNGNSLETVLEFNGRTVAENHDTGTTSHKPEEYIWYEFAEWYSKRKDTLDTIQ